LVFRSTGQARGVFTRWIRGALMTVGDDGAQFWLADTGRLSEGEFTELVRAECDRVARIGQQQALRQTTVVRGWHGESRGNTTAEVVCGSCGGSCLAHAGDADLSALHRESAAWGNMMGKEARMLERRRERHATITAAGTAPNSDFTVRGGWRRPGICATMVRGLPRANPSA
jgi:hypothetical protein